MKKCLAAMAGGAAILVVVMMTPNGVSAGASASAPSKYAHASQGKQSYPITEFSSSARRISHRR